MGPREVEVTLRVAQLGVTGREIPRTSEGDLLALGQNRTNQQREVNMRIED